LSLRSLRRDDADLIFILVDCRTRGDKVNHYRNAFRQTNGDREFGNVAVLTVSGHAKEFTAADLPEVPQANAFYHGENGRPQIPLHRLCQ
jgi:hypothetical protein